LEGGDSPLGTEGGNAGLGELEGLKETTPDKPRFRPDQEIWLLSCFLGSWWVHTLDLRRGWKLREGLLTSEAKSQR